MGTAEKEGKKGKRMAGNSTVISSYSSFTDLVENKTRKQWMEKIYMRMGTAQKKGNKNKI